MQAGERGEHGAIEGRFTSSRRRGKAPISRVRLLRVLPLVFAGLLAVYGLSFILSAVKSAQTREEPDEPDDDFQPESKLPAAAFELPAVDSADGRVAPLLDASAGVAGCRRDSSGVAAAAGSSMAGAFGEGVGSTELWVAAGEGGLDGPELSLSGWVFLLPPAPGEVASIQTIASSKASGCAADDSHHGVALFANEWGTNSEQLYASWGNSVSGCEELAAPIGSLPPGRWTFVAATFSPAAVRLYVDGALLADSAAGVGTVRATRLAT